MARSEIYSRLCGARLHLDDATWMFMKRGDYGRGAQHLRAAIEQLRAAAIRAESEAENNVNEPDRKRGDAVLQS